MRLIVAEFRTTDQGAPEAYGDAGCRLADLNRIDLILRHERYDGFSYESIHLFARPPEIGRQVRIDIFAAGGEGEGWLVQLALHLKLRCDFRLPGFNTDYLAPAAQGFVRRDVFRVRDGRTRRRIVRTYVGVERNVLLTYSLDEGDPMGGEFFKVICGGLSLSDLKVGKPFRSPSSED